MPMIKFYVLQWNCTIIISLMIIGPNSYHYSKMSFQKFMDQGLTSFLMDRKGF